jgi:signal transduction histidine kinase
MIFAPAMALAGGLVVFLSAVQADTLTRTWLRSSEAMAQLAAQQVKQVVLQRLRSASGASWEITLERDPEVASMLVTSAGHGGAIVEIFIANASGRVLASSMPSRPGRLLVAVPSLMSLRSLNAFQRFRRLYQNTSDYGYSIAIGVEGQPKALFTINVLTSTVLLRDALRPGMGRTAVVAVASLVLSLALVYLVAVLTAENVNRIGLLIDQIAGGGANTSDPVATVAVLPAAEFKEVGSKLALLDSRVRGALQDAEQYRDRVSAMLERLEEAILLFQNDRLMMTAGPVTGLLGLDVEGISGRKRRDILPPKSELGHLLERALDGGRPVRNQAIRWNGSVRERHLIVNLDLIGGQVEAAPALVLLRVRDAEGAGEVESQLQLTNRLEAINHLTSGVAHEIKNPLNAINARLGLLESLVTDEDSDAEEQIQLITREIERLDRVVRTFLDFTGPLEIARDVDDLTDIGRSVCQLLQPDAASRGVSLTFEATEEQSLPIVGDRDLLIQAVMNLAVNAVEAMPRGGALRIATAKRAGAAVLSVSDTGPGIPPEDVGRIFDLYFTTKDHGSGIGLAIAYRTAQLHGGNLTVESELDKGSTFNLVLPVLHSENGL